MKRFLAVIAGLCIVAAGIGVVLHVTSSHTPPATACPVAPTDATACLQALMVNGSTFDGHGASYEVDHGIKLTQPTDVTIEDASFHTDQSFATVPKTAKCGLTCGVPVFTFGGGDGVTVRDVTITGVHPHGDCLTGCRLVGQMGLLFNGTSNWTLDKVTADNLFGDGLDLQEAQLGGGKGFHCTSRGTIDGFTGTNDGRDGISPVCVDGLNARDVNVENNGQAGLDFEGDVPGQKAIGVNIDGLTAGSVLIEEHTHLNIARWFQSSPSYGLQWGVSPHQGAPLSKWVQVDYSTLYEPIYAQSATADVTLHGVRFYLPKSANNYIRIGSGRLFVADITTNIPAGISCASGGVVTQVVAGHVEPVAC